MARVTIISKHQGWQCERPTCLHKWISRGGERPLICPRCKSARWDQPQKKHVTKPKGRKK